MKLYSFPGSCALASHIALEWSGKPYSIDLIKKEDLDQPKFRQLNPSHHVPILQGDGWVLDQNAAILTYIADIAPEAKLDGEDPLGRAEVNRWLGLVNSEIHPAYKPLFGATAYLGDEAMIQKTHDNARKQLRRMFERCDAQLGKHEWIAGAHKSIADTYLFVTVMWTHLVKVDISGLDHLKAFERRMRADAGVRKALTAQGLDKAHAA
ncbi:MAG TPA: glutathione S-transferase C-terminal domain-containing protein [Rhodanobacteraceae bacterium]|nr:glutathione S-transferase C-terminal domain-containing protein [Rhodanobacteraceae bacterium]